MSDGWETGGEPHGGQGGGRSFGDIALGLWRAKWLMMAIFFPIAIVGILIAMQLRPDYSAMSRLYVSIGDEYVYRPRVDGAAAVAVAEPEQVVQAELEILRSPVVAERVLRRFGLRAIYPDLAKDYAEAPEDEREMIFQRGVEQLLGDFKVAAGPKNPVIATRFTHRDPQRSAEVLNALIGTYLGYRGEILISRRSDGLEAQRRRFETALLDAEADIQAFLRANNIGDFEAERAAANALYATVSQELLAAEARLRSVRGELVPLRQRLAATEPEQELFVESNSSQTLQSLQIEREQLLSRYTPDSTPVREIDKRIAQVERFLEGDDGQSGLIRRGPNPLFEYLQQRISELESEEGALIERIAALTSQARDLETRQATLSELQPRYQELLRQRDLYERNVRSFSERQVEEAALRELAAAETDNIRIIEPARTPTKGSSLKLPVAAFSILFAGFTALLAGLASAFMRRTPGTPRSVARATGLPVLAVARRR